MTDEANAMTRTGHVDWGCSDSTYLPGRPGHGVPPLSYDAAAVRARGGRPAVAGCAGGGGWPPDRLWAGRALRDGAGVVGRAADATPDQRDVAGAQPRRAQPAAADDAPVHTDAHDGAALVRAAPEPT